MLRTKWTPSSFTLRCRSGCPVVRPNVQRSYASSLVSEANSLRTPLEIDTTLQSVLDNAKFAQKKRSFRVSDFSVSNELDIISSEDGSRRGSGIEEDDEQVEDTDGRHERKSPAAQLGSRRIGSVTIPGELRSSIESLLSESDRSRLRSDAKRLFFDVDNSGGRGSWTPSYDAAYRSRRQVAVHADRDGIAFASAALPAQYSAIYAVLAQAKWRLGPSWNVTNVIDFGSGAGSGIWAAMHYFQLPNGDALETRISQSTIESYTSIDTRQTLIKLAKKLMQNVDCGQRSLLWRQKYKSGHADFGSDNSLALSAFYLSTVMSALDRKRLVKDMWGSGAKTIILIDNDSQSGFQSIAEARDYLLRLGRQHQENFSSSGCHVVAPCPHDGLCPLFQTSTKGVKCTFSQRMQRPAFVRRTKDVHAGHEDVGYSYVIVRRETRPSGSTLKVTTDLKQISPVLKMDEAGPDLHSNPISVNGTDDLTLHERLRRDAYRWARVVYPPLKRSGHVILDSCTSEGKIMRMIIPRSQGKQIYYDARKSSWGDLFPHEPKKPPQIRYEHKKARNM